MALPLPARRTLVATGATALLLVAACARGVPEGDRVPHVAPAVALPIDGWARTEGGAGGEIVRVTTLAPTGPGSFAEAVSMEGPRTVVFEVGGVIDLEERTILVEEPYLTVAGQTAPSPGITFIKGGIQVRTHDVILQHLRVRPGRAGHATKATWSPDGISTDAGARDVIIDHCSVTWAGDENVSPSGPQFGDRTSFDPEVWRAATTHRVTVSNNIIAEGLSDTHVGTRTSKGTLVHDNVTGVLISGNLYASNQDRSPLFKGGAHGVVVNNLIYNPGTRAIHYVLVRSEWRDFPHQVGKMAVVGNVLRHGPATREDVAMFHLGGDGDLELFMEDNVAVDRKGRPLEMVTGSPTQSGARVRLRDAPPVWPDGLDPMPSGEVEEYVLSNAGARPWDRDAIDARIVRQVRERAGRIVHAEDEVGGYPSHPETRHPFDPALWDLETMTPLTPAALR